MKHRNIEYPSNTLFLLIVSLGLLFPSCREIPSTSLSDLDRTYHFIGCILTPNGTRTYSNQIYVGKIIPNDFSQAVPQSKDIVLNRLLRKLVTRYIVNFEPITDARVNIVDQAGYWHLMSHIGNGFYENLDSSIIINPTEIYTLYIESYGQIFTATTTVPDDIAPSGLAQTELVGIPSTDASTTKAITWNSVSAASFYRCVLTPSRESSRNNFHTFSPKDSLIIKRPPSGTVRRDTVFVEALDVNYGKIYIPDAIYDQTEEWKSWFTEQNAKKLPERGNIQTGIGAVGVFGSENTTAIWYDVKSQ